MIQFMLVAVFCSSMRRFVATAQMIDPAFEGSRRTSFDPQSHACGQIHCLWKLIRKVCDKNQGQSERQKAFHTRG